MYRKPTPGGRGMAHPTLLLSLTTEGGAPPPASAATGAAAAAAPAGERTVHVEMSKEQLSSMLDGLGKIKEQLALVGGS